MKTTRIVKLTASTLLPLSLLTVICGCGTATNSCVLGNDFAIYSSTPGNTANHASTAPANQVKLGASSGPFVVSGSGCAIPAIVESVPATWTTSDPKDVTISSALDATNGTATCVNATSGPITITATAPAGTKVYTPNTATTTLNCK